MTTHAHRLLGQADWFLRRAEKLFPQDSEEYASIGAALSLVESITPQSNTNSAADPGTPSIEPIGCAICLNMDNTRRTPATTIASGYSVCDEHVGLASTPGFDIFRLRKG